MYAVRGAEWRKHFFDYAGMKEIILDLAEAASDVTGISEQLADFGIVCPGPRRVLNFIANRRWFYGPCT